MTTISLINYKGGVGKTTLAYNIAAEMAFRGLKILLIDLDPQMSLTFSLMDYNQWASINNERKTIKDWFDRTIDMGGNGLSEYIVIPNRINKLLNKGNISLICSHLNLIHTDVELAIQLGSIPKNYINVMSMLRKGIKEVKDMYDVIIIDCPPNFGITTQNAVLGSDYYIIPEKADYLSLVSLETLIMHINQLIFDYNSKANMLNYSNAEPKFLGLLFTMVSLYKGIPKEIQGKYMSLIKRLGLSYFETYLRESKSLNLSTQEQGMPIVLSNSTSSQLEIRYEMEKIVNEICSKAHIF